MGVVNGNIPPETQDRLRHALARLRKEPRAGERRVFDRRRTDIVLVPPMMERRVNPDRRQFDRRRAPGPLVP